MQDAVYGITLGAVASGFSSGSPFAAIAAGLVVNKTVSMITTPIEKGVQLAYNGVASALSTTGSYLGNTAYLLSAGALYLKLADKILPSNDSGTISAKVALAVIPVLATKILVVDPSVIKAQKTVQSIGNTMSDGAKMSVWLGKLVITHAVVEGANNLFPGNADTVLIVGTEAIVLGYLAMKGLETVKGFYGKRDSIAIPSTTSTSYFSYFSKLLGTT